MKKLLWALAALLPAVAWAAEVEGVAIAEKAEVGGAELVLNGAGVREKFFFDIYVGALYLPRRTQDAEAAIAMGGPKRVSMHFLYGELSGEKLADAWSEGFEKNQSRQSMAALRDRLQLFNRMFSTVHRGDIVVLDYIPGEGTRVSVRGEEQGIVAGEDFSHALLAVWLGGKPADKGLKKALLGAK